MSKDNQPKITNRQINDARIALTNLNGVHWCHMRTIMRFSVLIAALDDYIGKVLTECDAKIKAAHGVEPGDDPKQNKDYAKAWGEMMDEKSEFEHKTLMPEDWLNEFAENGDAPDPLTMAALLPFIELSENGKVNQE